MNKILKINYSKLAKIKDSARLHIKEKLNTMTEEEQKKEALYLTSRLQEKNIVRYVNGEVNIVETFANMWKAMYIRGLQNKSITAHKLYY